MQPPLVGVAGPIERVDLVLGSAAAGRTEEIKQGCSDDGGRLTATDRIALLMIRRLDPQHRKTHRRTDEPQQRNVGTHGDQHGRGVPRSRLVNGTTNVVLVERDVGHDDIGPCDRRNGPKRGHERIGQTGRRRVGQDGLEQRGLVVPLNEQFGDRDLPPIVNLDRRPRIRGVAVEIPAPPIGSEARQMGGDVAHPPTWAGVDRSVRILLNEPGNPIVSVLVGGDMIHPASVRTTWVRCSEPSRALPCTVVDNVNTPTPKIEVAPAPPPTAIGDLLRTAGLPAADLGQHDPTTLWMATVEGQIQGAAALEQYECYGLLRSVVVAEPHRGHGWARLLTESALSEARKADLVAVYLLTETAADYFFGLGFVAIGRQAVPPVVRQSTEFAELCPDTAIAMVRELHI